jgi:hypothetical protein
MLGPPIALLGLILFMLLEVGLQDSAINTITKSAPSHSLPYFHAAAAHAMVLKTG